MSSFKYGKAQFIEKKNRKKKDKVQRHILPNNDSIFP